MMRMLEAVTVNIGGATRRAFHKGREYIVAPLTMIVPGVLPGSRGPLYYSPGETGRSPSSWNGVPITVYHPTDPLGAAHISANTSGVWKRQGIGRVKNTTFNGKLRSEGWFDVKRTRQVDNRVLQALQRGEQLELSTGLFTDNEPQTGVHNGRPYTHIARNHHPDHLAVLPDQTGACSRQDGCGVNVVNATITNNTKGDTMRRSFWKWFGEAMGLAPTTNTAQPDRMRGKFCPNCSRPTANGFFSFFSGCDRDEKGQCTSGGGSGDSRGVGPDKRSADANASGKADDHHVAAMAHIDAAAKYTTAKPDSAEGKKFDYHMKKADEHMASKKLAKNVTTNSRRECPECGGDIDEEGECEECGYITDNAAQPVDADAPAELVGKKAPGDGRDISSLKKSGGAVEADEEDDHTPEALIEGQNDMERDGAAARGPVQNKRRKKNKRGFTMNWLKLLKNDPLLTTNMPAGGAFSGAQAAGYSAAQAAAMAGKLEGSYDGGGTDSSVSKDAKAASEHAESTKSKSAHKAAAEAHKTAAEHHKGEGNSEHAASHASAARSHAAKAARMVRNDLIRNCTCQVTKAALIAHNEASATGTMGADVQAGGEEDADGADDPSDYESDAGNLDPSKVKIKKKTAPTSNGLSFNQIMEMADPETRDALRSMVTNSRQQKNKIIGQLVANETNTSRRQLMVNRLMRQSVEELTDLLTLIRPTSNRRQQQAPVYLGAAVVPGSGDLTDNSDSSDLLDTPTLNFAEISKENSTRQTA